MSQEQCGVLQLDSGIIRAFKRRAVPAEASCLGRDGGVREGPPTISTYVLHSHGIDRLIF